MTRATSTRPRLISADQLLAKLAFSAFLLLTTIRASAVTPAILIGPDLKPREVKLQSLSGGKMTFFDAERTMQIEPTGKVLQVRFPKPAEEVLPSSASTADLELTPTKAPVPVPEKGTRLFGSGGPNPGVAGAFLELTDGQRLVATFSGADAEGQQLRFTHPSLGEMTIKLDQVSRLAFDGDAQPRATPASDQVLMSNGDTLTGFVVAVKETGIDVQQGDAKPFTLPRDRVKALLLANPVERKADKQNMVWLRDGTRLLASEVSIASDKLTATAPLAGKAEAIALAHVDRIELASLEGRLLDLADLPMKVIDGGKVFGLSIPPRVQGDVIRMHAPLSLEFALPAGAAHFAAVAELDADGEDAGLAHFIITVLAGGQSAARHAIAAKQPRAVINCPLSGPTLTLSLDPAANGPVMDRLRLRDAVIFIEKR